MTGKSIVYSATCCDAAYLPTGGAPLLIEISKVTVEQRPLTEEETRNGIEDVTKSVDLLDAFLEVGEAIAENDSIKETLTAFYGVGDIIKGLSTIAIPEKEDPMVKNLHTLENKVKDVGVKLNAHFAELKTFISELQFFVKIVIPTTTLLRYMRDCLKNPGEESAYYFKKAYEEHQPLQLAYSLISFLEQKTTNPVRIAMEAEKIKRKFTFKKWETIITSILRNFMVLEAFANGLMGNKSSFNRDILIEATNEIVKTMNEWKEEYAKTNDYWEELRKIIQDYMPKHPNLTKVEKCDEIKKLLDTYLTNDAFYIFTFDQSKFTDDFIYYTPAVQSHIICDWNQDRMCNILIYRSIAANKKTKADYEKLENDLEAFKNEKFNDSGNLDGFVQQSVWAMQFLNENNFIFMINATRDLRYSYDNCSTSEKGPGIQSFFIPRSQVAALLFAAFV